MDAGYTDAPMTTGSGTATPDGDDSSRSVDLGATPYPGPLGPAGPTGSGLLSLQDAVEAAAASEHERHASEICDGADINDVDINGADRFY